MPGPHIRNHRPRPRRTAGRLAARKRKAAARRWLEVARPIDDSAAERSLWHRLEARLSSLETEVREVRRLLGDWRVKKVPSTMCPDGRKR